MEARLGAVTALFLALAAIQFVLTDQTPASSYVTAMQQLVLTSYVCLLLVGIENVALWWLTTYHKGKERHKRHTEANRAYHEKLEAVRTAVDAWLQCSQEAARKRSLEAGGGGGAGGGAGEPEQPCRMAALEAEALARAQQAAKSLQEDTSMPDWTAPQQQPMDGSTGPSEALPRPAGGVSKNKELRLIVNQLIAGRGNEASRLTEARGSALSSEQSITVLRAAIEAVEAAGDEPRAGNGVDGETPCDGSTRRGVSFSPRQRRQSGAATPGRFGGGSRRLPIKRSDSKFLHLPWWQRNQARLKHHWRVFRQQVDEDPEYADAVAHRWNKWLALVQFVLYNVAVVITFAVASGTSERLA